MAKWPSSMVPVSFGRGARVKIRLAATASVVLSGALAVALVATPSQAAAVAEQARSSSHAHSKKIWQPRPVAKESSTPAKGAKSAGHVGSAKPLPSAHPLPTTWPAEQEFDVILGGAAAPVLSRSLMSLAQKDGSNPQSPVSITATTPTPSKVASGVTADSSTSGTGAPPTQSTVHLAIASHSVTTAAGVSGVIVSVSRVDTGSGALNTTVSVDYSSFIDAFGGDFSDRLVLESLPACALTTPNVASCRVGKPLKFTNDPVHHTLSAKVAIRAVPKTAAAAKNATSASGSAMVLAASSTPTSPNGSYTATPLKASDSWTTGGNSGSFTWSYPLNMPPALGGSAPSVSLDYDSSSVDGRTTASNSQPSDIGEGWNISGAGGYIETAYKQCSLVNPTSWAGSGDMCVGPVNATIGGGAHSGDLVHDDSDTTTPGGKWRLANDDGTRVQMLYGTSGGTNNTSNSAYWQLTETNGTVYLYGSNRLPQAFGGKGTDPATYSTWSEPVFGQAAGTNCTDPTNTADLPTSCRLAWRWNLDFKIDPNGNVTRYSYGREENYYQRNVGYTGTAEYTRSGFLRHIDYGWRTTDVANSTGDLSDGTQGGALPAATVQFQVAPRCDTMLSLCPSTGVTVNSSNGLATTGITTANESAFPDTPFDQHCDSGQTGCTHYVPAFYSSIETRGVVTSVNTGSSTGSQPSNTPANYRAVDSYQFPQSFPAPQDSASGNGPELWLNGINHTGYVTNSDGNQTATSAPEVQFGAQQLPNRSQASSLWSQAEFYRIRVNEIVDELGGDTVVNYSQPGTLNCGTIAPQATTANTTLCFPEYYTPTTGSPTLDWFNKYVVTGVTSHDNTAIKNGTGYSKDHTTAYTYLGAPAWHTNDSEQTDPKYRTVDEFRGFLQVQAITGKETSGSNAKTITSYFQGMDQDPTGYVCVNDSHNQGPVTTACPHGGYRDDNVLAGQAFETQTFASDTSSTVVTDVISVPEDPTDPGMVTAVHNRLSGSGLPQQRAHFNHVQKTITYSQVSTSPTPRRIEIDYTYDNSVPDFVNNGVGGNGALIWTDDKGETDASGNPLRLAGEPELCTWLGYAINTTAANNAGLEWTSYPNESLTWTVLAGQSCTANQQTSATITAHTTTLYDGLAAPGVNTGNVTATQAFPAGTGSAITVSTTSGYDLYGRPGSVTDADQHTTSTQYFPKTGLLPTQITTTNAMGWTSTNTIDRGRVVTLTAVDANGRQSDAVYDGLGRLLKGWNADHTKAANPTTPNVQYAYNLPGTSLSPQSATPNASTETQTLLENDSYAVAYSILDGFGEQVETQSTPLDDGGGLLSTQAEYNSFGKAWRTAAVHWDKDDRASGTYIPYGDALPSQTVTTYDGLSRPLTVSQYTGSSMNPIAGMVTTYGYPGMDRTDESGPTGGTATSTFTDGRGRTTELWTYHENPPARPGDYTDADRIKYGLSYQANGTVSTVTDEAGNTWTTTTNDLLGHNVTKSDPDTGVSTTIEDNAGLLQQTTDARGKTLSFHYDTLGRKRAEYAAPWSANPDQSTELASWNFDTAGASDNKTTRGLASSSTRYSQGGSQPGYVNQVNSYDAGGRPTSASVTIPPIDGNGVLAGTYTTNNTYTPVIGLLYETDLPAAGGLPSESVYNSYNDNGLLLSTAGNADYLATTQYDHDGKILSRTIGDYPYQVVQQDIFDAATQRLTNQYIDAAAGQNSANPSSVNTYAVDYSSYTYNAAGLVTSTADLQNWSVSGTFPTGQPGQQAKDLQCYTYDYADRLTNAWADNGDQNPPSVTIPNSPSAVAGGLGTCKSSINNTPPTASNLGGPAPYWQSYTFDATKTAGLGNGALTGNRSTVIDHDVTGNTAKDVTRTSSYPTAGTTNIEGADPANGPGSTGTGPHLLTTVTAAGGATGTDQYTYDGAGNTTGRKLASGANQTLTWDAEQRLATVTDKSVTPALTATYVYDADGNQLIRRDTGGANAGTTLYLGATEIHLSGTSLTGNRYYAYDGAPGIIEASSGAITYEIADSHGTGGTTIDAADGLIAARRYTKPYGDARSAATGTFPDDHTFLGKTTDTATGLIDVGARKYDALTGRFISADPVFQPTAPQALGGYAYAGNNPVSSSDPSGLRAPDDNGNTAPPAPRSSPPAPCSGLSGYAKRECESGGDDGSDQSTPPSESVAQAKVGNTKFVIFSTGGHASGFIEIQHKSSWDNFWGGVGDVLGTFIGGPSCQDFGDDGPSQACQDGMAINVATLGVGSWLKDGAADGGIDQANAALAGLNPSDVWDTKAADGTRNTTGRFLLERAFGANMPDGNPGIDIFKEGAAVSIKSIDASPGTTYEELSQFKGRINSYVRDIANYNGNDYSGSRGWPIITKDEIQSRGLILIVRGSVTTDDQIAALAKIQQVAATKGVTMWIGSVG